MNYLKLIQKIEKQFLKKKLPLIKVGDHIRLGVSIRESGKERIQFFSGIVIAYHKANINTTITVRTLLQGIGIERVFPINASCITTIEILRHSKVSRSKLYFLRNRTGKAARLKEKIAH